MPSPCTLGGLAQTSTSAKVLLDLQDKEEMKFSFMAIGILAVQREALTMTSSDDCLLELDAIGHVLQVLLRVSLSYCHHLHLMALC